jgi:hypothetical protein
MSGSGFSGQQPSGTPRRLADREDDHRERPAVPGDSMNTTRGRDMKTFWSYFPSSSAAGPSGLAAA